MSDDSCLELGGNELAGKLYHFNGPLLRCAAQCCRCSVLPLLSAMNIARKRRLQQQSKNKKQREAPVLSPEQIMEPQECEKQLTADKTLPCEHHEPQEDDAAQQAERMRLQAELIAEDEIEQAAKGALALDAKRQRRREKKRKGKGKFKKSRGYCSAQLADVRISDDDLDGEEETAKTKCSKGGRKRRRLLREHAELWSSDDGASGE